MTVDFNMDKFTKPGIYYYRLTEQGHGISGLSTAPLYLLKVSVANESEAEPDGQHFAGVCHPGRERDRHKAEPLPTSTRPSPDRDQAAGG
ncbi:MAG: hypothetical protein ACLTCJ_09705 [Gemmiger formicilis]